MSIRQYIRQYFICFCALAIVWQTASVAPEINLTRVYNEAAGLNYAEISSTDESGQKQNNPLDSSEKKQEEESESGNSESGNNAQNNLQKADYGQNIHKFILANIDLTEPTYNNYVKDFQAAQQIAPPYLLFCNLRL